MDRQLFEQFYEGQPPWDIEAPQPAFVRLAEAGQIPGRVLDVGCGTGDHALYLATRGQEVWGLDFVAVAIERAQAKAAQRGVQVNFLVGDALELEKLNQQFDSVIDSGLFHTFSDEERPVFVRGLAAVLRPQGHLHILCFSDAEPGAEGPRRVTQQEIRDAFQGGWTIQQIEPARFEVTPEHPVGRQFSPGGPKAWLASIQRI